ncbi:hypothetical protein [Roseibium sp. RKSG952]|uniref:hypothetical protein n=1 Tax=Roseibium sp. RKSG952 TaxID=2529384 RepID=UPI0012BB6511|nr:hypothetical protein [Roseibium sp. RKSG952]MTH98266.1 hypothetical protein [Roseibium sp. RKSG952]
MTSAIVDGVLLLALIVTTIRMISMYRELKRLGSYHEDYKRIFDQTSLALDGIEVSVQEINVRSSQLLNALGSRMDDARELIAEIDTVMREAKRQQAILKAELKEISRAAAHLSVPERFNDPEVRPAPNSGHTLSSGLVNTAETQASDQPETALSKKPTRIHRIDEASGSPFRSVSLNHKEDL